MVTRASPPLSYLSYGLLTYANLILSTASENDFNLAVRRLRYFAMASSRHESETSRTRAHPKRTRSLSPSAMGGQSSFFQERRSQKERTNLRRAKIRAAVLEQCLNKEDVFKFSGRRLLVSRYNIDVDFDPQRGLYLDNLRKVMAFKQLYQLECGKIMGPSLWEGFKPAIDLTHGEVVEQRKCVPCPRPPPIPGFAVLSDAEKSSHELFVRNEADQRLFRFALPKDAFSEIEERALHEAICRAIERFPGSLGVYGRKETAFRHFIQTAALNSARSIPEKNRLVTLPRVSVSRKTKKASIVRTCTLRYVNEKSGEILTYEVALDPEEVNLSARAPEVPARYHQEIESREGLDGSAAHQDTAACQHIRYLAWYASLLHCCVSMLS